MQSIKKAFKAIGNGFFNNLVERSIKVYIQKHLGEFLLHKLSTDQVDVGLDGGSFASLYLDPETINSRLESINAPFTLVEGYVDIVHLMIPWQQLPSKSIIVEIDGLILTVRLTEEEQDDGMDVKSMLDSMSASMVEEMLKSKEANGDIEQIADGGKGATPYETVEFMSDFITSIMTRIQVKLENVNIMVEKSPGIQVDLTIDRLHVYDEQSVSAQWKRDNGVPEAEGFSTKIVEVSNVAVYVVEMPSQKPDPPQTMDQDQYSAAAFNIAMSSPPNSGSYMTNSSMTQSFYPGMDSSQLFPQEQQQQKQKTISVSERMQQRIKCRIPIVNMDKKQMLFIQTKNNEQLSGPSVDVTWTMETLHVLLSPQLLGLLT
ncbi:autophagy-related protein 2 homolog A, partial [Aplysia californica]|uniref:Autophagy-related protein 2 n=1 Tax=Aplysia californica TaxID=6500 RepID=A0ABM1AFU2_APLCA